MKILLSILFFILLSCCVQKNTSEKPKRINLLGGKGGDGGKAENGKNGEAGKNGKNGGLNIDIK
ncbi:MAG: hypothetical protein CFE22_14580 [Cytophagaceae bacterium BCCC1]|nr:MAG: hypothetical protein CFE22_14580 [Cytophagaceae bacterium BCCC1]